MTHGFNVAALAVISACVVVWGLVSARLERWDISAPIAFVVLGVVVTHGPTTLIHFDLRSTTVRSIAEVSLALVLFGDASRVNVRALRSMNFAVGIFLAGLAGVLASGQLGLEPTMGDGLLMPSFIAIIVGGVGSLTGTLLGGLIIGVAAGLTAVVFPSASDAVMYVIMAIVLLVRPRGLFGEEGMLT